MTKTDFQKDIIAELHKSENTNSSNLDAEITFFNHLWTNRADQEWLEMPLTGHLLLSQYSL